MTDRLTAIDDYRAAAATQLHHQEQVGKAAQRKIRAIRELRATRLTWVEIGQLLGISAQRAQKIAQRRR